MRDLFSLQISLYTFSPTTSKKKQTLTSQKTKKITAKKEIKKQTIEEILAEHTPTRSPALQRREEEAAGTDHHQYPRLHYLGPRGQPSQDPCRRETSSAVYPAAKDAYPGGSGPGTSQGRHQPRVTGTRLSESKQIFKLRASLVFMTRG